MSGTQMSGSIHPEYAEHVKVKKIKEMDEEDNIILNPEALRQESTKFDNYGEYDYIAIPEDRRDKIKNAIESLHETIRPTLKQLNKKANFMEIQNKMLSILRPFQNQVNYCVRNSQNITEVNYCSDRFVEQLLTDGRKQTIQMIRDY